MSVVSAVAHRRATFAAVQRGKRPRGGPVTFLADHVITLVVGVVCVPQLAIGTELELEKLVPELAFMPGAAASGSEDQHNVAAEIEAC